MQKCLARHKYNPEKSHCRKPVKVNYSKRCKNNRERQGFHFVHGHMIFENMKTYVKFSLENLKLLLASGSSFLRVYPRKGFDRALARFARNLEVSLNNPRKTSYVEPEVLNKSDKLPKLKKKSKE